MEGLVSLIHFINLLLVIKHFQICFCVCEKISFSL